MTLNIKSAIVVGLVRQLARVRHVDMTEAIRQAVGHELARDAKATESKLRKARAIVDRIVAMPVLDDRPADEIIGYNDEGLPS